MRKQKNIQTTDIILSQENTQSFWGSWPSGPSVHFSHEPGKHDKIEIKQIGKSLL